MKQKVVLILSIIISTLSQLNAQSQDPIYRQYFFNPYLFNPAFVGIQNQTELSLVYRQQWVNFKDAPVTAGLSFQYPTKGRVMLGVNIISDKQVLLNNSSFSATFGYVVPLAENQTLRVALSGGAGMNNLSLTAEELNSNDPAILRAAGNNYYAKGNFGVVYTLSGLKIGFALPNLFKSNYFSPDDFSKVKLSNLKSRVYSASYRFNLDPIGNIAMEPYFIYKQSSDGAQNSWEAATVFYFRDKLWTGAGYNQYNGIALFLGFNVKDKFAVSYGYEFAPFKTNISTSSHELHLNVKLGQKRETKASRKPKSYTSYRKTIKKPAAEISEEQDIIYDSMSAEQMDTVRQEEFAIQRQRVAEHTSEKNKSGRFNKEVHSTKTNSLPEKAFVVQKGHYVVIGAFTLLDHALKFAKLQLDDGHYVNIGLNDRNHLYYVYVFSTLRLDEAKKVRTEYRLNSRFKDAWIFTVE